MSGSAQRLVVVGGGLAGHRAACALRAGAPDAAVTVIGAEVHRPYDRPPLSKAALADVAGEERCSLRGDDLDAVDWRLGRAAVALDPDRRVVVVDGGEEVPYDGLAIATGRRARTLPAADDLAGVHTLRTLDDARALRAAAARATAIAIVGAGFVGCEVAATLRATRPDLPVTVVDVAAQPMPVVGPLIGARAVALHEEHGVVFRLGHGVERLEAGAGGAVRAVVLDDGTEVAADLVLVAIGSLPNTEWLAGSGLALERGAVVCGADCLVPGHPDIAVCGDVAAWPHPAQGGHVSIEHWSNAQAMGTLAAENLLAAPAERAAHTAFPTFWSDQYGWKLQSIGFIGDADRYDVVHEDAEKPTLVVEAFAGDRLVGAIAVNRPRAMLQYRRQLA